jgi:hypothetical protein
MSLAVDIPVVRLSACDLDSTAYDARGGGCIQVYCDPPTSQVIHLQNTADHVSSQVIKHKDLPYRLTILIEDRSGLWYQSIGCSRAIGEIERVYLRPIEVEHSLYRGCTCVSDAVAVEIPRPTHLLGGHEATAAQTWSRTSKQLADFCLGVRNVFH